VSTDVAASIRAAGLEEAATRVANWYGVTLEDLAHDRRGGGGEARRQRTLARRARYELWHAMTCAGWRMAAVARLFRQDYNTVSKALVCHRTEHGEETAWRVPGPSGKLASASLMLRGPGERHDDCANYATCLDAFVRESNRRRSHPSECHCPTGCTARAALPRHALVSLATATESPIAEAQRA
jgi:hypothetical protein